MYQCTPNSLLNGTLLAILALSVFFVFAAVQLLDLPNASVPFTNL